LTAHSQESNPTAFLQKQKQSIQPSEDPGKTAISANLPPEKISGSEA
jgi:hypothetical protein